MTKRRIREPEQIRRDCVAKLYPDGSKEFFGAILGYLLREDWGEPRIEDIYVEDESVLARTVDEVEPRLIFCEIGFARFLRSLASAAGLDGDETGYLLAAFAKLRRVERAP